MISKEQCSMENERVLWECLSMMKMGGEGQG